MNTLYECTYTNTLIRMHVYEYTYTNTHIYEYTYTITRIRIHVYEYMYSEYTPPQKQELSVSLGIWSQEVSEMSAGRRWLNAIKALYSAQEHGAKLLSLFLHKVWYFDVGLKPWRFQSNLRLRIFINKISIGCWQVYLKVNISLISGKETFISFT